MHTTSDKFSFIGAALSLIVTYVTAAVPIPLYGLYQTQDQIGYLALSISSVVYFVGAVTALLLFGRLTNYLGRKPVSLAALLLAALSVLFFVNLHHAPQLIAGRLLQRLACGLASTALAVWLIDHAQEVPGWIPAAVISCGPMTGLTIGGVGAGALIEYGPFPRQLAFVIALGLIALAMLMVLRSRETMARKRGGLRSLRPHFTLPASARKAYPLAACTSSAPGHWEASSRRSGRPWPGSNSTRTARWLPRWCLPPSWHPAPSAPLSPAV